MGESAAVHSRSVRPSGVNWIGVVPSHWAVCALTYRYEVQLGKMLDTKRISGTQLAPYLRNTDVQWGSINIEDLPEMDFTGEQRIKYALRKGDVLVCEGGEVGRAAVWSHETECYYQKALHRLRPLSDADYPPYLVYALQCAVSNGAFETAEKSTIAHLPADALRQHRFAFPPKAEQIEITRYLDRETARIDALICEKKRLRRAMSQLQHARISEIISGSDQASEDTGDIWLPQIPRGWTLKRLKHLGQVRSGLAKGKKHDGGVVTTELPYMRVANVQDGHIDLSDVATIEVAVGEIERFSLAVGDVLMNEGGDYDKLGRGAVWNGEIAPCLHQNHVFAVRLDDANWAPWVSAVTRTAYARFYFMNNSKQSTNLASISQTNVKELPVAVPPVRERDKRLVLVAEELSRLQALDEHVQQEVLVLTELRSSTISGAVLGRIDVNAYMESAHA